MVPGLLPSHNYRGYVTRLTFFNLKPFLDQVLKVFRWITVLKVHFSGPLRAVSRISLSIVSRRVDIVIARILDALKSSIKMKTPLSKFKIFEVS